MGNWSREGGRDTVGDQAPQPQNRRAVNERWPEMNATAGKESPEQLRRVSSEAVLEGTRKGEIVSGGAAHNSAPKEGNINRGILQDSLGRSRGRGRGAGVKADSWFDSYGEDDFFDQPGFGSARSGDGGADDMFEDFATCRARNRRMNGAADSKLQLERRSPVASGEDKDATAAIRAAIAQNTRRDANEHLAIQDSSSCAEDGNRCLEKDINANPLKTAAKNYEVKEISYHVGHRPHADDHLCRQAEESIQPDPSTSSNSADAEEFCKSRARVESSTENDGPKEENLWRRGRLGEEVGPGREDGSWRRDTGARSDGAWRKSKSGDEGMGVTRNVKVERQDRMGAERDDRSTWRRSEQDDPKTDLGVLAERGVSVQENQSKRFDQERSSELKDAAPLAQKTGRPEDQGSRSQGCLGIPVGLAPTECHVKCAAHTQRQVEKERERVVETDRDLERAGLREREIERLRQERLDAVWEASFDAGEVLPWHQGASPASIRGLPIVILVNDVPDLCSICLENLVTGDSTRMLPCLHRYHLACIDQWLECQGFCPICKTYV